MLLLRFGGKMTNQKELFIATLIHDIKNPLSAQICSILQLLNGNFGKLTLQQEEILNLILESSYHLQHLLQNVLFTYKNDNGQISLNKNYFNVCNLIKTCILEFSSLADEKNLNIILTDELHENNSVLFADENQLRRVIENLLINQINYAFKNTTITISLLKKNNNILLCFENNSPEISDEKKEVLFEKYTSKKVLNTNLSIGLGLYLSKQIISAHEGNIYLVNNKTLNKFVIEIPINNIKINKINFLN